MIDNYYITLYIFQEFLIWQNNIEAQVFLTNEDKNLFQKTFGYFEKQKYFIKN